MNNYEKYPRMIIRSVDHIFKNFLDDNSIEEVYEKYKSKGKAPSGKEIATSFQINLEQALEMAGGDKEFVKELFRLFVDDCPQKLQEIKGAIDRKDFSKIAEIAHTLKSSSGNLGITAMYKLCLEIEKQAKEKRLENMEDLYVSLKREYERFRQFVSEFEKRN